MKSLYFPFFLLLLLIASCNTSIDREDNIYHIDLNTSLQGKLSDKISGIEYILLDAADDQPLVEPYNIKFSKNYIFIQDFITNELFVFDGMGKIVNILEPKGRGPGEFFQIKDFHTNSKEQIILQDPINSKIQIYDPNGELKGEIKSNIRSMNFYGEESFSLFFMSYGTDEGNFNFIKNDKNDHFEKEFLEIPEEKANSTPHRSHIGFVADPFRDQIYFVLHNATELAYFDKNSGDLMRHVHFDFGDYNMPIDIWKKERQTIRDLIERNLYVTDIGAFVPFKDQYFMYVNQGGKKKHHIFLDEDLHVISQSYNQVNDLDGIKINVMPWTFTEDEVVYKSRSSSLYNNYLEAYPEGKSKNSKSNIHEFFNQNKEKLKDDMWVLIKLKVKPIN